MFLCNTLKKITSVVLSDRYLLNSASVFKYYHLCCRSVTQSPQLLNSRYIVSSNEKRNDISRGDYEVSQAFICFKYLRLIKYAIRESGPVVENNQKLSHAIKNAKKYNLSPEFIDFAIKISCDVRANVGLFDVLLPGGCHFVIQYEDIDPTITKHHLLELCERYDGNLNQESTKWPQNFHQKGIILVRTSNSDSFFNESKETILSKVGAESFHKEIDAEGLEYWKFICDSWALHEVKKQLYEITDHIEEALVGYVPQKLVTPSQYVRTNACSMFLELCKVPTIDNVYDNIKLVD